MSERRHARVLEQLPLLEADELQWWRRRLVERHLRRCDDCAEEALRQQQVAAELAGLGAAIEVGHEAPAELLDRLLDQAADPGLRARVAAPARGAVSGARPGMSVVLVLVLLGLAAAAVYAGWRVADRFTSEE